MHLHLGSSIASEKDPTIPFKDSIANTQRSYQNVKKRLSDNGIQTHNHLVRKQTLNYLNKLASLAKWLNVALRTKWLWV